MRHPSDEWLERSHGWLSSKIHLYGDGQARPLVLVLAAGWYSDVVHMRAFIH